MSHSDAEQALAIYRLFCKQAEKVVEFLTVAKKLQNIVNVPVPNLKHVCTISASLLFNAHAYLLLLGPGITCGCSGRISERS